MEIKRLPFQVILDRGCRCLGFKYLFLIDRGRRFVKKQSLDKSYYAPNAMKESGLKNCTAVFGTLTLVI